MMTTVNVPHFDIESFKAMRFSYSMDDDIAVVHIDQPQPAVTIEVDDGWYLRVANDEVVGIELHGLQRVFLSNSFYSRMFAPAVQELAEFTGESILERAGGVSVSGTIEELPRTMHLLIFMIGQATMKYQDARRGEYSDAGRTLLAS